MIDKFTNSSVEEKRKHFEQLNEYRQELLNEPLLQSLFIEMTILCNQNCRHCGSNCGDVKNENALTDIEIINCLLDLKEDLKKHNKPLPFLCITGGEPLLRPTLVDIMSAAHKLGYKWGMTSNGLLIDECKAKQLKEAGMYSIGLSLDGLEESHNWFRRVDGSYQKTIEAIKHCVATEFDDVMVTTVVHQKNINELDEMYELVNSLGCNSWRVVQIDPIGRALENNDLALTNEQLKYLINFIETHRSTDKDSMDLLYSCNHYLGLEHERKVRNWYFSCRAGITVASIQFNGNISACLDIERRDDLTFGNIRTHRLYDQWVNEFKIFRQNKEHLSSKCSNCEERDRCHGNGWHTWNFETNEPRVCIYEALRQS